MMHRFFRRRTARAIESAGRRESEAAAASDSIAASEEVEGSSSAPAETAAATSQTLPESASESALTYDPNSTVPHPTFAGRQLLGCETSAGAPASVGRPYADDRYRILGVLGEGGMGIVYRAEDRRLGRIVALKRNLIAKTTNASARRRFLAERAASALDHPNICTVHGVVETAHGQPLLSMPCYEGETLKDRLERGPLPLWEALEITFGVAHGLAKAHGIGIIHCDIKPANLMITRDGLVKILDFGIARLLGDADLNSGVPGGTPKYRSPEQARGEGVGPESDIWSLGLVLFEMLAGRLPSRSQDGDAFALKALATLELPRKVHRLLARMLAPEPAARFPHAVALLQQLDELREPVLTKPTGSNKTRWFLSRGQRSKPGLTEGCLGLLWTVLFALGGLTGMFHEAPEPVARQNSAIEKIDFNPTTGRTTSEPTHLLRVPGELSGCDSSPDGRWLVCWVLPPREELFLVRTDGGGRHLLLSGDGHRLCSPVFSPQGSRIAFSSDRGGKYDIWSIGVDGKDLRKETNLPIGKAITPLWSPDGRFMAVEIGGRAALIDLSVPLAARSARLLPSLDHDSRFTAQAWSPDGKGLAGVRRPNQGIWIYSFASGQYSRLTNEGNGPAWLVDSRQLLFFRGVQGFIYDLEAKRARRSFTLPPEWRYSSVKLSPNGRRLYVVRVADVSYIWWLRARRTQHH
ncbi:MAG TPA: protein kinase [Thermoanaerobaculia bacterium]